MQYSLETRLKQLHMSKKKLCEECNKRGRKISYNTVLHVLSNEPYATLYQYEKKVTDTLSELEKENGITDIEF